MRTGRAQATATNKLESHEGLGPADVRAQNVHHGRRLHLVIDEQDADDRRPGGPHATDETHPSWLLARIATGPLHQHDQEGRKKAEADEQPRPVDHGRALARAGHE